MAEAREKARKRHDMEAKAAASLPEILKQYKWDLEEIDQKHKFKDSFWKFTDLMWEDSDVVWVGDPEDTGQEKHKYHFCLAPFQEMWGNYTTASTFKPGSYSRSNVNVLTTPYLITEGDKVLGTDPVTNEQKLANKNACGAVFKWLQEKAGLKLRAIVDSGNKSLHAWWEYPDDQKMTELRIILPAFGFDRAMFKPSQPARLPGIIRDNGNEQKLLWIS